MNLRNFILLFWLLGFSAFSQNKKQDLESEKQKALKELEETGRILAQTKAQKKATLGQLNAIKKQISGKEKLIGSISGEVELLEAEIIELQLISEAMSEDLRAIKEEYAAMIYAASKTSVKQDRLLFLFSSKTFDQLVMRLKYLQQYAEARKEQVVQIDKVKQALLRQKAQIEEKKLIKQGLLDKRVVENESLINLKNSQDKVAKELSIKEKELKKEIKEKKKSVDKLNKLIADMVQKEIEESRKRAEAEAKKNSKVNKVNETKTGQVTLTPETKEISTNFGLAKGKLPWPTLHGFISQPFGKHPHPILKHVIVDNLGVEIQTNKEEQVRVVADGKVTAVAAVPGMNQVVMVQHGEYFTVYARLKSVSVKTGQVVKFKDEIGVVYTDGDGVTELQFQVWKNSERQNPEEWLFKK